MRCRRPQCIALSLGALFLAGLALAPAGVARAERLELEELASAPIELIAPLAGTTLVGGATAEIAWQPTAGFDALAGATEWEAFLSVDGGRTYPVRITPHLDLDRRRFVFPVPDLPSPEARLLLRIGDERAERAVRFPTPLRIDRSPSGAAVRFEAALAAAPATGPGEAALADGAGVLFWVEGDRDGSHLRQRSAVPPGTRSGAEPALLAGEPAALGGDESGRPLPGERPRAVTHPAATTLPRFSLAPAELLTVSDILLLIQRLNE